ncbi:MAG: manganese efflux pump [Clostridium sp.]|nr:manganese efflux pump [Clostridium sp.]
MSLTELFIIAVGLSMDAFAVAVCKGLAMPRMSWKGALIVGLYFGGFQAAMPLLGYFLGSKFSMAIRAYDHWVAFLLLVLIGAGMVKESFEKYESCSNASLDVRGMVLLAVATSIDALAVGVTFAFLNVDIVPAVSFIGAVTFTLSMVGVKVGNAFGCKYKSRAELAGGAILILMGLKILLEHLGLLAF